MVALLQDVPCTVHYNRRLSALADDLPIAERGNRRSMAGSHRDYLRNIDRRPGSFRLQRHHRHDEDCVSEEIEQASHARRHKVAGDCNRRTSKRETRKTEIILAVAPVCGLAFTSARAQKPSDPEMAKINPDGLLFNVRRP
jgi:hypothetical protein